MMTDARRQLRWVVVRLALVMALIDLAVSAPSGLRSCARSP